MFLGKEIAYLYSMLFFSPSGQSINHIMREDASSMYTASERSSKQANPPSVKVEDAIVLATEALGCIISTMIVSSLDLGRESAMRHLIFDALVL